MTQRIRREGGLSFLQRGDLVEIVRRCHSLWAVYTGEGDVIHFSPEQCAKIEKLFGVAGDSEVYKNNIYGDRIRISTYEDLSILQRGDLVEIVRGRHSHWAVYTGEGDVIHFSPEQCVKMEKLFGVAGDSEVYKNNIYDDRIRLTQN